MQAQKEKDEANKRIDDELRRIFVEAYRIVLPHMRQDGSWISLAHECMAQDALTKRFSGLTGMRLLGVLATISRVVALGRTPVEDAAAFEETTV